MTAVVVERCQVDWPGAFFEGGAGFFSEAFAVLLDSAALGDASVWVVGPAAVLAAWERPGLAHGQAQLSRWRWDDARRFDAEPEVEEFVGPAFAELERMLAAWAFPMELRGLAADVPFVSGAVGIVGFDAGRFLERLPGRAARDVAAPAFCFLFADAVFVHSRARATTELIVTGRAAHESAARRACSALQAQMLERLARQPAESTTPRRVRVGPVTAHADAVTYAQTVQSAREHILAGDVFEVCTAHRLTAAYAGDAQPLYAALRAVNPAQFAGYLATPWACLVSSSPERFLSLDAMRQAESRPIKGTRPRSADPVQDARLRAELAASEKDRAENVMIVDLVRNDFGRVCEVDSVHVPQLMIVEEHPSVFHLVSTVRGQLAPNKSAVELFCACFPPGSMTGAPKVEAMKLIDALEPYGRSWYAGALGYFDARGSMDFSVVIRSFVLSHGCGHFSVGGAVVSDSDPDAEYAETMDKARPLFEALARVRVVTDDAEQADEPANPR